MAGAAGGSSADARSARLAALQASPCRAHLSFASPGGRAWPCRATGRLTLSPQIRCWITCCPIGRHPNLSRRPARRGGWWAWADGWSGGAIRERMLAGKLQPPLCSAPAAPPVHPPPAGRYPRRAGHTAAGLPMHVVTAMVGKREAQVLQLLIGRWGGRTGAYTPAAHAAPPPAGGARGGARRRRRGALRLRRVFVDVFDGGQIMDAAQFDDFLQGLGLAGQHAHDTQARWRGAAPACRPAAVMFSPHRGCAGPSAVPDSPASPARRHEPAPVLAAHVPQFGAHTQGAAGPRLAAGGVTSHVCGCGRGFRCTRACVRAAASVGPCWGDLQHRLAGQPGARPCCAQPMA